MKKNNKLFSKALFKQSCKANGLMWLIITVAVCFMLGCVMLISGKSEIGEVKENIETTIINHEFSYDDINNMKSLNACGEIEYKFDSYDFFYSNSARTIFPSFHSRHLIVLPPRTRRPVTLPFFQASGRAGRKRISSS